MAAYSMYKLVKRSYRFLHKKKYVEALALIESVLAVYPSEPYVLFLHAVISLHNNRFDRAYRGLDQLEKEDPDYEPLICLKAFLTMKGVKNKEDASAVYGDLISRYPHIKDLYRALDSVSSVSNFAEFQKHVSISDMVPVPSPPSSLKKLNKKDNRRKKINAPDLPSNRKRKTFRPGKVKTVLTVIVILLIIFFAASTGYYFFKETYSTITQKNETVISDERIDQVTLGGSAYDLIQRINRKPVPEFYYSPNRLSQDFNKAKILIKKNKLNNALLILNKINNSNANQLVKEKVIFLIKFVIAQENRNYQKINFKSFTKKLYLYRGFAIKLSGKISNIKKARNGISFTLLVNYDKHDNFSGVINIFHESFLETVKNGKKVMVEGVFITTVGEKKHIHIVAHTIKATQT